MKTLGLAVLASSLFLAGTTLASHAQSTSERKLVKSVEPDYPETLKRLYIGGVVRLEVVVSRSGAVDSVTLLGGNPVLGQSAIAAVKKWKYEPADSSNKTQLSVAFRPTPLIADV